MLILLTNYDPTNPNSREIPEAIQCLKAGVSGEVAGGGGRQRWQGGRWQAEVAGKSVRRKWQGKGYLGVLCSHRQELHSLPRVPGQQAEMLRCVWIYSCWILEGKNRIEIELCLYLENEVK
jgi:hypothetical protein